jgi:hypothetical protein
MKKHFTKITVAAAFVVGVLATTAFTSIEKQQEAKKHPRIEAAIDGIKDAIQYMDKAPDDFGGNKAAAIADCKAALKSLHKALGYRYKEDKEGK